MVRAAAGVDRRREVPAMWVDDPSGLTKRRVVDLGRTSSMMCRVWMPGH